MEFPNSDPRPIARVTFLIEETKRQIRAGTSVPRVALCDEVELGGALEGLKPHAARTYVVVSGLEGEKPILLGYSLNNREYVGKEFLIAGVKVIENGPEALLALLKEEGKKKSSKPRKKAAKKATTKRTYKKKVKA